MEKSLENNFFKKLFNDSDFVISIQKIDTNDKTIVRIVKDIINCNWINPNNFLLGYKDGERIYRDDILDHELIISSFMFNWFYQKKIYGEKLKSTDKDIISELILKKEGGLKRIIKQLQINKSEVFTNDILPQFYPANDRLYYSHVFLSQNGFYDFDNVLRLEDECVVFKELKGSSFEKIHDFLYEGGYMSVGENKVKNYIINCIGNSPQPILEALEYFQVQNPTTNLNLLDFLVEHKVTLDPYKINEKKTPLPVTQKANHLLYLNKELKNKKETIKGKCTSSRVSNAVSIPKTTLATAMCISSGANHASRASSLSILDEGRDDSIYFHRNAFNGEVTPQTAKNKKVIFGIGESFVLKNSKRDFRPWGEHKYVEEYGRFFSCGNCLINEELVKKYCIDNQWLSIFSGWYSRSLYAIYNRINFYGFDTSRDVINIFNKYIYPVAVEYNNMNIFAQTVTKVIQHDSTIFYPEYENKFLFEYSSPPYFDLECYDNYNPILYGDNHKEFCENFLKKCYSNVYKYLKKGGICIIQVDRLDKSVENYIDMMENIGFILITKETVGKQEYSHTNKTIQNCLCFTL